MKTLTVGGGGREHAMMLAFAEQEGLEQLSTQANAGMEQLGKNLGISSVRSIVSAASNLEVDFVAVGPEAPLIGGLADRLRNKGIPVLGFGAEAAKLESSRTSAADFTDRFKIAAPKHFDTNDIGEAEYYAKLHRANSYVIKADGPAFGHGVILPDSHNQARQIINSMMRGELFGDAGRRISFQERLTGPEVSMFALTDGKKATVLFTAQDHKRLKDGDKGPNTGGMGAYSPIPPSTVSSKQMAKMYETLDRTLDGMEQDGINSPGVLFLGFMLAEQYDGDPMLIEYNVRLGDPEAQVGLPLLTDAGVDVHELFYMAARGALEGDRISTIKQSGRSALTVCLAAEGYPAAPRTGDVIYGINREYKDVIIHHGGTEYRPNEGNRTFSTGGRVVHVTGLGETVGLAAIPAYKAIGESAVNFGGMQYRTDIGHQAISASAAT